MMAALPPLRDGLSLGEGYHSPRVDVAVRLNVNESPLGPPRGWVEEVAEALGAIDFNRYPDRSALGLREAIGACHGVGPEQVFAAKGSNEVLQSLLLAFGGPGRVVATFEPTYMLHSHIARVTGTAVVSGGRRGDFRMDLDEVERVTAEYEPVITFVCSPNNPTGGAEPRDTIEKIVGIAHGLVVVDEAYGQFAPWSALEMVSGGTEGVVVVRTFSKTWAMAACRLGYLVAAPDVVRACEEVVLPYHLDAFTQVAGRLALDHIDEMNRRVAMVVEERGRLAAALSVLDVDQWPSDSNFILFRPRSVGASTVWQQLVERSILVRNCDTWPGLSGCLRVTVGTPGENEEFLVALTGILASR